jgi:N-acetylglucosaminyldiphosphoundecaprenol N-acetyl-beta-D-mannosaminyltransferase
MNTRQRLQIQGARIDNIDSATALRHVDSFGREHGPRPPRIVFFVNVHSLHLARKDPELLRSLNTADLVLPDGSGLALAGRLFGHPIRENVNGTDFLPKVMAHARDRGWSVFLLGGKQAIVERCGKILEARFPGIRIAGVHHGHCTEAEQVSVTTQINTLRPDILLVGMGTPIQESWIMTNAPHLAAGICFAVGGFFDFLAGDKPRAPIWLRRAGLEWIFRFAHDPGGKWNRVMVEIPVFLGRMLGARLFNRALLMPEPPVHNEPGGM